MQATISLGARLRLGFLFCVLSVGTAGADLPDPTRPPSWSQVAAAHPAARRGLVLESTLIAPDRKLAIINGRPYPLGSRVGGAVITAITPSEVTLSRRGGNTRLRLLPIRVKAKQAKEDKPYDTKH